MPLMKANELQSFTLAGGSFFIYPVYWINLKKSKSRRTHMIKELNKLNIKNFRVDAINGKQIEYQEYYWNHPSGFNISTKTTANNTLGEIGCALSHIKAIKTSFNNNDSICMIMEDDISFKLYKYWDKTLSDIVNNAPKDWDIIQLNTSNADELWKMHTKQNTKEYLKWNKNYYSCLAYIINKNGMKKVLSKYDRKNIDSNIFVSDKIIYKECNTYTLSKPLFLFELKFESTLQEDRIKLKKFKEENWEIKTNEIVSKHMYNIPPETPIGEYKWWEEENTKLDDF